MSDLTPRIPEEIADEVFQVASQLYAQAQSSYSLEDLQKAGQQVNIPPELIEKALQQVQEQKRLEKEQRRQQQQQQQKIKLIAAGVGVIAILWGVLTFNGLNGASQKVNAAWAQVENQLQRKADLIPQLVSVTNAQAQHEKDLVKTLLLSREAYLKANTQGEKVSASQQIDQALQRLNSYATQSALGSSQGFINLQYEIAGTENRIATERKRYNEAVQTYNQQVSSFPNSLIASIGGFKPKEFFKAQK